MPSGLQHGVDELMCPADATVDIVFVHGLSGDRTKTWSKGGVLWPQVLLPHVVPNARILTFGYEADVVEWNHEITQSNMETHAADLCDRLAGLRSNTASIKRPVIFVAHSLGGLICAQMVVKGATATSTDNVRIVSEACTGIIFLGTPFHGSGTAKYMDIVRRIVNVFVNTNSAKIDDLNEKSKKLESLVDSFASRLRQRAVEGKPIEIQFFVETLKTNGVLVVPEKNARIPGYESWTSMHANHINMCKYSEPNDEGYKSLSNVIKKFADLEKPSQLMTGAVYNTWNNNNNTKVSQQASVVNVQGGQHFH